MLIHIINGYIIDQWNWSKQIKESHYELILLMGYIWIYEEEEGYMGKNDVAFEVWDQRKIQSEEKVGESRKHDILCI